MEIITDNKGVVFKNGAISQRVGFNTLTYEFAEDDTVTFMSVYDGHTVQFGRLGSFTLNGETLTAENYDDKLKAVLFKEAAGGGISGSLTIKINGVDAVTFDGSSDKILDITPEGLNVYDKEALANALVVNRNNNNIIEPMAAGEPLDYMNIEATTTFHREVMMMTMMQGHEVMIMGMLQGQEANFSGPVRAPEFIQ